MEGIRRSLRKAALPSLLVLFSASPPVAQSFASFPQIQATTTHSLGRGGTGSVSASTTRLAAKSPGNPFVSLIGDFASSMMGSGNSAKSSPQVEAALATAVPSSWADIRSLLESKQTPEELKFRENLAKGYGIGSPLNMVRLYGDTNKEDEIRVTFYRDHASWCPYCQKVWFALEEKKIPYRVEKINMNCYGDKRDFLMLQPNGQIPVALIDRRVYGSSNDILAALEQLFPDTKSLAPPKGQEMKTRELLMLERTLAGAWLGWLRSGGNSKSNRQNMESILGQVERALVESGGPFFLGKDVTIVDVQFLSFLERMCASLLFFKGFKIRVPPGSKGTSEYPAINRWFDALEEKPAYQLTKSDYYTHCWDLPPQLGGCTSEPEGEPYRKAINGERTLDGSQGSWELPLVPHNGGIEPDWEWAGDEAAAKREAVERVSANYEAIVRFASRGAGRKGMPPVMAPLADPNATPNEGVQAGVSAVLRTVALALLDDVEQHESTMTEVAETIVVEGGKEYFDGVVASLAYLRDRVGVPRDMKLPAARQLRAHLNWAISKIVEVQDA